MSGNLTFSPYSTEKRDPTQMKSTPKNTKYTWPINVKILRWGPNATYVPLTGVGVLRLGLTQILGLASGVMQIFTFLDTNMLVSPTRNSGVGGLYQRKDPTRKLCVAMEYRLKDSFK